MSPADRLSGGIRIEGLNRIIRELQQLGVEVEDLKGAFGDIAADAARLASSFAPRRSGKLAASIRGNRAKNKAVVVAGRARVPYAAPVNYGWPRRNVKPALFMQAADEAMRPRALAELETAIENAVRRRGLG